MASQLWRAPPRAGLRRYSSVPSSRRSNSTRANIFDEFLHVVGDHHRLQQKDVARCMGDPRTTAAAGSVSRLLDRCGGLGIIRAIGIGKFFYRSLELSFKDYFAVVDLIPQLRCIFNLGKTRV